MKPNVLCNGDGSLRQLLLFNLFLQLLEGCLSYRMAVGSARLGVNWVLVGELVYYKALASLLLLFILHLGNAKPQLAARALFVTASMYTLFALYYMQRLVS